MSVQSAGASTLKAGPPFKNCCLPNLETLTHRSKGPGSGIIRPGGNSPWWASKQKTHSSKQLWTFFCRRPSTSSTTTVPPHQLGALTVLGPMSLRAHFGPDHDFPQKGSPNSVGSRSPTLGQRPLILSWEPSSGGGNTAPSLHSQVCARYSVPQNQCVFGDTCLHDQTIREARSLLTQKSELELLLREGGANRGFHRAGTQNVPFLTPSGGNMAFMSSLFLNLHMYVSHILQCKRYSSVL